MVYVRRTNPGFAWARRWVWAAFACVAVTLPLCAFSAEEPIDVGNRKQLFVDDALIQSRNNVDLVMNPPYQTGEVLITADEPWEAGSTVFVYSSVLKDRGVLRVWYDLLTPTGNGPYDHERRVCYAESEDGIHFVKPRLGLHEVGGSTANNVVLPGVIGGCAVWIDPNAPPEHRYKTQTKVYPSGEFHMHRSPDGLRWSLFANIDPKGPRDTQTVVFWDPYIEQYVFYGRHKATTSEIDIECRSVRRAEMANLTEVRDTGLAIWPDDVDRAIYNLPFSTDNINTPVDYYGATVFPYEEADRVYLLLAQSYWHWIPPAEEGGKLGPATQDVRLAVSRDGKHFDRAGERKPFIRLGPAGRFDSRWAWAMPNPVRMGDEIWIYYVGSNQDHNGQIDPAAPDGKRLGAISRAVMRLDGFISADAPYEGGVLVTRPLRFAGDRLELNLDTSAGGGVRVELLDETGQPLDGFSGDASPWIVGNAVRLPVTWSGAPALSSLEGAPVKIRFTMRDCKLYAFQFVR